MKTSLAPFSSKLKKKHENAQISPPQIFHMPKTKKNIQPEFHRESARKRNAPPTPTGETKAGKSIATSVSQTTPKIEKYESRKNCAKGDEQKLGMTCSTNVAEKSKYSAIASRKKPRSMFRKFTAGNSRRGWNRWNYLPVGRIRSACFENSCQFRSLFSRRCKLDDELLTNWLNVQRTGEISTRVSRRGLNRLAGPNGMRAGDWRRWAKLASRDWPTLRRDCWERADWSTGKERTLWKFREAPRNFAGERDFSRFFPREWFFR